MVIWTRKDHKTFTGSDMNYDAIPRSPLFIENAWGETGLKHQQAESIFQSEAKGKVIGLYSIYYLQSESRLMEFLVCKLSLYNFLWLLPPTASIPICNPYVSWGFSSPKEHRGEGEGEEGWWKMPWKGTANSFCTAFLVRLLHRVYLIRSDFN